MEDQLAMDSTKDKLIDSFKALSKEYRISKRWREHFFELFYEIDLQNKSWTKEDKKKNIR